jgi:hypothetical protein
MEGAALSETLFSIEKEYARCVAALDRAGPLMLLPASKSLGVMGLEGKEYPVPTQQQVAALFTYNRELAGRKVPQGFYRLQLTPLAMSVPLLLNRVQCADKGLERQPIVG